MSGLSIEKIVNGTDHITTRSACVHSFRFRVSCGRTNLEMTVSHAHLA